MEETSRKSLPQLVTPQTMPAVLRASQFVPLQVTLEQAEFERQRRKASVIQGAPKAPKKPAS